MRRDRLRVILFRHRGGLLLLLVAPIVAAALRPHEIGIPTFALGSGLVAAGVALRGAAVRRIGRAARMHQPRARYMIAAGPYRWTRNPLYLAAAVMVAGFGVLAGVHWAALVLFAAALLAYTPVVIAEEEALQALFGETYQCYLDSVPRWIGTLRLHPASDAGALVPWREVLQREKWLVPGSAAAVLLIAALGSDWIDLEPMIQRIEHALGVHLSLLAGVAVIAACGVHTIKVEVHQRRRRAAHHLATGNRFRGSDPAPGEGRSAESSGARRTPTPKGSKPVSGGELGSWAGV